MNIVIAGAGAVGTHLAKLLVREKHNITLIDPTPHRLDPLSSNFDILTLTASPLSVTALRQAEVQHADLYIAVLPDEAHNMTSCMLAKQLGAKRTVARVDNYEYTLPDQREVFTKAGIDSVIYPELLAGREIAHNVRHSWVRQWWEFQDGKLLLLGIKVRKGATMLGKPLREICPPESPFLIVALKHDGETLIPHGNDLVQEGDLVFFMTTPQYTGQVRSIAGKEGYPDVHNVFVMGGSDTAEHAVRLMPPDMHAKVFEMNYERAQHLTESIGRRAMIVNGDGRDLELLQDENISSAQAFLALTDNSESNILACLAAKRLGVRKTVAMIENSDYISMAESLDIGCIINKKTFAASHIYQMMLKADVTSIKTLTIAAADVVEIKVAEGTRITRHPIKDLGLPATVNLGGLVRDGKAQLINGNTQVKAGDTVVAFCLQGEIKKLDRFFKPAAGLFS
ncbi:MAG: Trk system potassium transporter TrkA [Bacteroidaceae bacterium]|nr:Trk system potassium transporter TrkA [Bacteroidaceae bacterium]